MHNPSTDTAAPSTASTRNAVAQQPRTVYTPLQSPPIIQYTTASRLTKNTSAVLINERQRGNPLIQYIKAVPYEYHRNITPDYIVGEINACLYISLKYHVTHPRYIQGRFDLIGKGVYQCRVLLVQVDIEDSTHAINELTRISMLNEFMLILCFSLPESARYIESFKVYENKSSDSIQEKIDQTDHRAVYNDVMSYIKGINKTDTNTLIGTFHSFHELCSATMEDIALCNGFGEKKVKRLYNVLHAPFISSEAPVYTHFNNDPHKLQASNNNTNINISSASKTKLLPTNTPPKHDGVPVGATTPVQSPISAPTPTPTPAITNNSSTAVPVRSNIPPPNKPVQKRKNSSVTTTDTTTTTTSGTPKKPRRTIKSKQSQLQSNIVADESPVIQPISKLINAPHKSVDLSDDVINID